MVLPAPVHEPAGRREGDLQLGSRIRRAAGFPCRPNDRSGVCRRSNVWRGAASLGPLLPVHPRAAAVGRRESGGRCTHAYRHEGQNECGGLRAAGCEETGARPSAEERQDAETHRVVSDARGRFSNRHCDALWQGRDRLLPVSGFVVGPGLLSGTALCARSARRSPFDSREHRSGAGGDGDHRPIRVPLQDRMHVSGNEASDRCLRLPLLELIDAEAEPLSSQRRVRSAGARDGRTAPETDSVDSSGHRRVCHVQLHRDGRGAASRFALFRPDARAVLPLSSHALQVHCFGGNGRDLFAQIDFSPVCPKPVYRRNPNYSFQTGCV